MKMKMFDFCMLKTNIKQKRVSYLFVLSSAFSDTQIENHWTISWNEENEGDGVVVYGGWVVGGWDDQRWWLRNFEKRKCKGDGKLV
jgi:hypothetical protein